MGSSFATCTRFEVTGRSGQTVEAEGVYTMSQLNQHTAQVLAEINERGRPAMVTKHGRFVAMLTPMEAVPVESRVLSAGPLADDIASYTETVDPLSADDVRAEIASWED